MSQTTMDMAERGNNLPNGRRVSESRRRGSANSLEGQTEKPKTSSPIPNGHISFRDRIRHFTWAWFTCTMSTGGIALVIAQTPHRFPGLTILGDIVFILDLVLFLSFTTMMALRFIMFPKTMVSSLSHPTESLFFPTFWISVVNILSNIHEYGLPYTGEWLVVAERVLFWTYTACAFCVAVGQFFFLFTGKPFTIHDMTPSWILPVFPIMLCGTLASVIGDTQPPQHGLPILIAGVTFQGLGIMVATFLYGPYMARLFTSGLPRPDTRPGMFIAVGPPSFTGLALLGISQDLINIYPSYTTISDVSNAATIPDIFRVLALSAAVFLWATAFWFFSIALVSVVAGTYTKPGMSFHLVWYAFVFPNVGFTISTIMIGRALMSQGILWVGSVMTVLLVAVWLGVCLMHIRAVWRKRILWPGKDEDHDQ